MNVDMALLDEWLLYKSDISSDERELIIETMFQYEMEVNMGYVTQDNYPQFKALYEQAVGDRKDTFTFEGQGVLTQYAKYLVQYIEQTD